MKISPFAWSLLLAASAGLGGFAVGRGTASASDKAAAAAASKSTLKPGSPGRDGGTAAAAAGSTSRDGRRPSQPKLDLQQIQDRMSRLMQDGDAQDRTRAWLDFVDRLEPGQFEQVVADYRALGMSKAHMAEYAMLLSSWAKHDPLAALDFAEKNTGNAFARQTILATWATRDLEGALAWAQSHFTGNPDQGNPWLAGVIRGIAATDPVRSSQLLAEMPRSGERRDALASLAPTILAEGPQAAMSWVNAMGDSSLSEDAFREIAPRLAEMDPRSTADWLASSSSVGASRTIDDVMTTWMKSNPAEAMAYYQEIPSGEMRTNALVGLVGSLASSDPGGAAAFLNSHRNDADDNVYQEFVRGSLGTDPVLAVNEIANIKDTNNRDRTYLRAIGRWMQRDPNAAQQWVNNANLPTGVTERLQQQGGR